MPVYAIALTSRQVFSGNLRCPEVISVAETRNPKAGDRSDFAPFEARALDTDGTRLAHWPPPFRSLEAKPKAVKRPRGETPKRATPRGWRITRAMFSEFDE
jgi:hypothetical protein